MANYSSRGAEWDKIAVSPEIRAVLAQVGEKAKTIAEGLSQDFRSARTDEEHPHYADSFEVAAAEEFHGRGEKPRAVAHLVNTSPHAAAVEYGYKGRSDTEEPSAHRVLGRTLAALDGGA